MTNVNGSSFRGQASASKDFSDENFEEDLKTAREVKSPSQKSVSKKDSLNLVQGKTPFKILYILDKCSPKKLQATEISKLSGIHRVTISGHCKELFELGVIRRDYLPGTENKVNPTYLFSTFESLKEDLTKILKLKIEKNPAIAELEELENIDNVGLESNLIDTPIPESNANQLQAFDQIKVVITKMAKEIKSLRQRVSDLEKNESLKQNADLDFSEALDALGIDLGDSK